MLKKTFILNIPFTKFNVHKPNSKASTHSNRAGVEMSLIPLLQLIRFQVSQHTITPMFFENVIQDSLYYPNHSSQHIMQNVFIFLKLEGIKEVK